MCCMWALLSLGFLYITTGQDATLAQGAILSRLRDRVQFLSEQLTSSPTISSLARWAKPWETIRIMNTQNISIQYTLVGHNGNILQTANADGPTRSLSGATMARFRHATHGSFLYRPAANHPSLVVFTRLLHRPDILLASIPENTVNRIALGTLTRDHGILALLMILITIVAAWFLANRFRREFVSLLAVRTQSDADAVARRSRVVEISQVAHTWATALQAVTDEKLRASWLADHDPLTGLYNRRGLLDKMTALASANAPPDFAFVLLDLDHFKHVNDTYGHGVGDELLQSVGRAMLQIGNEAVSIARIGGDEFAAILPSTGPTEDNFLAIARDFVSRIQPSLPAQQRQDPTTVTFSVGATIWRPNQSSIDETFYQADLALYASKDQGRNQVTGFSPTLYREAQKKARMGKRVMEAMTLGGLRFRYQPVISLESGQLLGVEALLRWRDGDKELLPDQFLPYIIDPHIMDEVESFVLHEVITQAERWHREGLTLPVSINVSPQFFLSPELPTQVENLLRGSSLPPHAVSLEVVGNAYLADMALAIRQIKRLQQAGAIVAIDNFGTGYASLSYLLELPVNYVKLDRSFTAGIRPGSDSWIMVSGVVALCQAMGRMVITEAIETPFISDVLYNMGVTAAQGDWYGPPMTPDELKEWIQVHRDKPSPHTNPRRPARNLVVMIPYQVLQWAEQITSYAHHPGTAAEKQRLLDQAGCLCGIWLTQLTAEIPQSDWGALKTLHHDMHQAAKALLGSPPAMTQKVFDDAVNNFLKRLYLVAAQ